jgi:hypothetical protein
MITYRGFVMFCCGVLLGHLLWHVTGSPSLFTLAHGAETVNCVQVKDYVTRLGATEARAQGRAAGMTTGQERAAGHCYDKKHKKKTRHD